MRKIGANEIWAFVFIGTGFVLMIQGVFWFDPVMATIAGGSALSLFGSYIWLSGPAPSQKPYECEPDVNTSGEK